jgi:hypothetical protein
MAGESGTSHTEKVYRYYKCLSAKKRRGCKFKPVKKGWIEDLVVTHLVNVIFDDDVLEDIANTLVALDRKESDAIPLLRKQLFEYRIVWRTKTTPDGFPSGVSFKS